MRNRRSYKRRSRLPKPKLQLKMILVFLAAGFFSVAFQFVITTTTLLEIVKESSSAELEREISYIGLKTLLLSVCLLIPLVVAVGTLVTFRVAGPIKRFEMYFRSIARGEDPGPCRIRKGDELQDLCEVINQAVATLREERAESEEAKTDEAKTDTIEREAETQSQS